MKLYGLRGISFGIAAAFAASIAIAAPVTYRIDPGHTYPSIAVDHMGGVSKWRGKFNSTSGTVVLDKEAQSGSVDIKIDTASLDFGHERLNAEATSPEMLDAQKFPTATYTGKLAKFKDGKPTEVQGSLTLHGVTKPVNLKINSFLCKINPRRQEEVCGADASGTFSRDDFGVSYGKEFGFGMEVELQIQIEASPAT